jgi:hypothetical protein
MPSHHPQTGNDQPHRDVLDVAPDELHVARSPKDAAMITTAEFSVSAAHSGSVVMTRVSLDEVAALLGSCGYLGREADVALLRTLAVRETLDVGRRAYRVIRVA